MKSFKKYQFLHKYQLILTDLQTNFRQLKEINSIKVSSTKTAIFSDSNIENGIQALKDLPMNEWKPDELYFSLFQTHALAGALRLLGIDPGAAAFLPERLAVDGLLSVWQAPLFARSDR